MAKEVYAEDLIEDFLAYEKKKYHTQGYMKNMRIFMEYLIPEPKMYNLASKRNCRAMQEYAMEIVVGNKKDYPLLKATKVDRGKFFNSFVDYLGVIFNISEIKLEKIPFVMNELERKLDLVKHYREYYILDKLPAQEVAQKYYVDEKTIRNDKREIRDGTLNAFGQKIDIEYDDETKTFFSTPVPIFMVQNITQIVAILNGLGYMYKQWEYSEYAKYTAVTIWHQLTSTVKKRIRDELVDLLYLDKEWYELIDSETSYHFRGFYPEREMNNLEHGNPMLCLKNPLLTDIDYAEGDEIKHISGVHINMRSEEEIEVEHDEERFIIKKKNIIKVSENGN